MTVGIRPALLVTDKGGKQWKVFHLSHKILNRMVKNSPQGWVSVSDVATSFQDIIQAGSIVKIEEVS